jgi:hypothetical protein
VRTADDDSVPVPYDAFRLPRAVLNWKKPYPSGVSARRQRDELEPEDTDVSRLDARASSSGSRAQVRASTDDLDDEPTRMMQVFTPPPPAERPDVLQLLLAVASERLDAAFARAAKLWRDGPLRTATMLGGVALVTYLATTGVRHGSATGTQTVLAPAAAMPAAAPIIVEQLNGARQPRETVAAPQHGGSDRPSARSATSNRAREASFAPTTASKSSGYQTVAPAQSKSKSRRAERSRANVSSGSAGLPAWGAEAVQEFSGGSTSGGKSAPVTSRSQALTAKPPAASGGIPPPMAAYRSTASAKPTASSDGIPPPMAAYRSSASSASATASAPAREPTKPAPVVAAKPAEPPKPVAPARPSKPLTMDQVLNQVEEAAQAQRKKAGLKAPKTSKRDAELDELISGSMKSKK